MIFRNSVLLLKSFYKILNSMNLSFQAIIRLYCLIYVLLTNNHVHAFSGNFVIK